MKRFGCLAGLTLGGMIIMAQTNGTGETVTTNFEHAIHNIPGKSVVAQVVDYAPGGASPSHEHAKSAFTRPRSTRMMRTRLSMFSTGKLRCKFAEARFGGLVPGRYFTNHLKTFIP
jgi:hypothetical protein